MSHIVHLCPASTKGRNGKYRARFREVPGGPQRSKCQTFSRKTDARAWLTEVEHQILTGTYTPREAGQITLASYVEEYTARRHWRPQTAERKERELRLHILPTLGSIPLANLTRSQVERWAKDLELAPSSVHTVHATLSAVLNAAVEDGRIPRNPASGAHLPEVIEAVVVPLDAAQIHALAEAVPDHLYATVILAAGCGLRHGELFGLRVHDVDWMRRELHVRQQLVSPSKGTPVLAPVKEMASRRTMGLSPVVLDALSAHLAEFGAGPDVVFHTDGHYVTRSAGAKAISRAGRATGLSSVGWHDLRHYQASTLLSQGVNPAYVAERLGHSVETLLRTYAHSLPRDDDRVRALVDQALAVPEDRGQAAS
jgi:integrase